MPDVRLHLGDCLEVMRGMADGSVDAIVGGSEVDAVPFHPHVAGVAQAHEILGEMGLVGVGECSDGPDVMDIESPARDHSTSTAASIPLAGGPAGGPPGWAIVTGVSAPPSRIPVACPVSVTARKRAENHLALAAATVAGVIEDRPAVRACRRVKDPLTFRPERSRKHRGLAFVAVDVRPVHRTFRQPKRPTLVVASARTEDRSIFSLLLAGGLFGRLAACRAGEYVAI
jgi:hypothetical protein